MSKIDEYTFGDVRVAFVRYRPFIAVVACVALLMIVLPGRSGSGGSNSLTTAAGTPYAETGANGETSVVAGDGSTTATGGGGRTTVPTPGGASLPSGGASSGGGAAASSGGSRPVATGAAAAQGMVDNCDPATGRIAVPSRHAPICVPKFSGDNGGSTYRGVTGDTIKVVFFRVQEDAATDAVLTAAGANDSDEQVAAQVADWVKYYESHYQMYGRKVEMQVVFGSGPSTDAAAGRADAIKVADELGAFAVLGAPNNTFVDEVVARGVMCMCTVSQPIEAYLRWAPYVWTTLLASTQGYVHRAEYIGKRLGGGQKAQWAGDVLFQQQERKFGVIYYDTDDKSYRAGIEFFIKELRDKYGISPAVVAEYHGYPETARSQEEARPLIQKLVQAGITSVICVCDPFGPIFFTSEATRQAYQPEWVITGSALTDTSFFARLYDQLQWQHAFGISYLTARLPEELSESYRLHIWQHGREPSAPSAYGVIRSPIDLLYWGIHLSGPNLNPESFRNGMFAAPPSGENSLTSVQQSFGPAGRIWPWDDYISFDDVTEIWWDPSASGEDEIGNNGTGLYRYVDMGKRYLPGKHPATPPKAFDEANTVTIYTDVPEADRWPEYPSPAGG